MLILLSHYPMNSVQKRDIQIEYLNYKRVLILGIELDSRGVFRDSEDYLISNGFFLTDSQSYSDGIYLNTYENNS